MVFNTLEERFTDAATQIYNRFSPSEGQLTSIKPDTAESRSRIKDDSRLLPVVSTVRDTVLLTKFLSSPRGQLFVAKQLLLQTGNTFAESRLYAPYSPLIAAVPGIPRIPRQVVIPSLFKDKDNTTYRGALQDETINKTKDSLLGQLGNVLVSPFKALSTKPKFTNYFNDATAEYYLRPEDLEFYGRTINLTWKRNGNISYYENTQLYTDLGSRQFKVQPLEMRGNVKQERSYTTNFVQQFTKYAIQSPQPVIPGSRTFKELENTLNTNGYFVGKLLDVQNISPGIDNATIAAQNISPGSKTKYPTVLDPYNGQLATPRDTIVDGTVQPNQRNAQLGTSPVPLLYQDIIGDPKQSSLVYTEDTKSDIIKFAFRLADTRVDPVHFRAFLSSLKETVKPEFSEQRYLGRTERFVTYGGAKRTVSLAFNVVAFSANERDQVWKRINFLTSLAYPTSVSDSGFMTPPLFRISIGGIYDDQPCYIDTLNYTLLDDNIIFDIDAEVPTVVDVDMSIVLLEKQSQYYDSPFYKITEELV